MLIKCKPSLAPRPTAAGKVTAGAAVQSPELQRSAGPSRGLWLALAFALAGCSREDVKTYQVPKPSPPKTPAPALGHAHGHGVAPGKLKATLPTGWQEGQPDPMRVARYVVPGPAGQQADVSVIPLGRTSMDKAQLINIWRQQLRLEPANPEEVARLAEPVIVGGNKAELFNLANTAPLATNPSLSRILVAMLDRGDVTWSFKMSGPDELVRASQPGFLEFLKSVSFEAAAPGPAPAHALSAPATPVTADKPAWQVPAGWQEHPPTSMLLAKFLVTADAAKATVTVSRLEGDGGGLLPNVNRWRGQIGLPPIDQAGLEKLVSPREAPNRQTVLVDMAGGNTRMLAAVVPVAGQTWFFKFLGDTAAIEQQKAAFLQFVQSTKFTAP